jgi:multidrug efflux pump subunit AcrB
MNISTWSIRNPIPTILLFILLTGGGYIGFKAMKVQNFPDIELPNVVITAVLPGAAPAQIETEVARKIENSLASINGLKHTYTKIQDGQATITAEFRLEKSLSAATEDVRDAVNRVRSDLPGALKDPIISKFDLSGQPILTYTLTSNKMDEEELSWYIDNEVSKLMLGVAGVGRVARVGGVQREISVALDPAKMSGLNVTVAEVSRRLQQIAQEASGGRSDIGGSEQSVRTIATVSSATEIAALDISLNDGRKVRLDQIAKVSDTIAERRSAALLDGKPAIGFEITRSKGAGELDVNEGVQKALKQLKKNRPDFSITEAFNFVKPVEDQFYGSLYLLIEGAALAVLVVLVFLRDWRATFVSATALPLSVIPTFIGMHALGFTLNVVSLLSLALVVGVLVDDAIVEIENIVRHMGNGKSPKDAAIEAVEEIGLAVIATTFTLIAVFLPTAFMSGVAGKFFVQFGWTAAIAVFASLVVARLLTPMMAAYMLKPSKQHETKEGWVMRHYLQAVRWCLAYRWITIFAAALFFAGGIYLARFLETGFIPPDDLAQTQVTVELPPGSRFDETFAAAEQARKIISQNKDVKLVYTAIGGGSAGADPFMAGGASEARKATLLIQLSDRSERKKSKQDIETELRDAVATIPGIRAGAGFGGAGEKYIIGLISDDGDTLTKTAQALERDLRTIPNIGGVKSSASLQRPEVIIRPDAKKAADLGITTAAIADTVRVATIGDYDQSVAKLNLSQRQIPIMVRLAAESRKDISTLERLGIPGKAGNVPLSSVASIEIDSGAAQIDRYDRSRIVQIEIETNGIPLGKMVSLASKLPTLEALPANVKQIELGDVEGMQELFASFGLAMLIGVFCIYSVLVLLFKDFMQPVTILVALILSVPGAILALLVAQKALTMPSMIGMIMLMGIATKNSILLVEYAIMAMRDHGMTRTEALVDACAKRARPVVMTTIAMGAGMLPIALGFGVDPSFRSPMAVVVIGGLITSTFLSLLVIPAAFTFVDSIERLPAKFAEFLRRPIRRASSVKAP